MTPWGKLRNDLEPAVLPKYLFLAVMKQWLKEQSESLFALMAGSLIVIGAITLPLSARVPALRWGS